ncbi:four helix bundle protein [bacterium]|nr:four helix bundle protein [bacterium]
MGLHSEAKLDRKFMEFAKIVNLYLNHFPNHEKFGIALEIRKAMYDTYGLIVECQRRYHKKTALTNLDIRHEQLRMFIRLAHELGYFGFKSGKLSSDDKIANHRYLNLSKLVDELGKMIGGWILNNQSKCNWEAS